MPTPLTDWSRAASSTSGGSEHGLKKEKPPVAKKKKERSLAARRGVRSAAARVRVGSGGRFGPVRCLPRPFLPSPLPVFG